MPRADGPPPSNEFHVKLSKPFSGCPPYLRKYNIYDVICTGTTPTHVVEIIGEPNKPANIKRIERTDAGNQEEKTGSMSADDVQELLSLLSQLRGLPSSASKDIYGRDTKLDLQTFEIQWSNGEAGPDPSGDADKEGDVAADSKDTFGRVVESVEAAARQFAKQDKAL